MAAGGVRAREQVERAETEIVLGGEGFLSRSPGVGFKMMASFDGAEFKTSFN